MLSENWKKKMLSSIVYHYGKKKEPSFSCTCYDKYFSSKSGLSIHNDVN